MSEWQVRVVNIKDVVKHENADTLSVVNVDGGYPCIAKTADIQPLMIYVCLDSIVPDTEQFYFLCPNETVEIDGKKITKARYSVGSVPEKYRRIKARRFRGVFSMGLLIPALPGMKEGDVVDKTLNVIKYEPDLEAAGKGRCGGHILSGECEKDPGFLPIFTDINSLRKYGNELIEGEEVVISEKLHGCSGRAVYKDGKLWVGSHTKIKRNPYAKKSFFERVLSFFASVMTIVLSKIKIKWGWYHYLLFRLRNVGKAVPENVWWKVAKQYDLEEKLKKYPDIAAYFEVFGQVQDLKYGAEKDQLFIRLFDALNINTRAYLNYDDFVAFVNDIGLETVPILFKGAWTSELKEFRNGKSTISGANHMREGFVVKPVKERYSQHAGRVIFKLVGEDYLLRKE